MTTTPHPEWLSRRHDHHPDQWRVSDGAPLFGYAHADHFAGQIVAPTNNAPMSAILRTYALVQARYGLSHDDLDEVSSGFHASKRSTQLAHTHYLQAVTNKAIGTKPGDWKDGTGQFHAQNIQHARTHADAFTYALTHIHTGQSNTIARALTARDPQLGDEYKKAKRTLARLMARYYHKPATNNATGMMNTIGRYAQAIDELLETSQPLAGDYEAKGTPNPYKPEPLSGVDDQWYPVIPARVSLNRPHLGKIGTRRHATDTGKSVRNPSRALTDPARRVFSRRTRAQSALVVLDMSGSMNYTTDDLDALIEAVRGAIVVGYSANNDDDPNFYLLAKDGHRVSEIPEVCGGNGNDGPAFTYAVKKYRKTPTTPVIWVSDGAITGRGDYSTKSLARNMVLRLQQARATQCENIQEARQVFDRLTRGQKPAHKIDEYLLGMAGR